MCYDAGRRFFSRHFIVFVRFRTPADADWRVGMAVTKKVGCAVRRNRVKRVLREFFRLHQALLPPATDFVVVPKRQLKPERVTLDFASRELLPLVEEVRSVALSRHGETMSAQRAGMDPAPGGKTCGSAFRPVGAPA